MPFVFSLLGNTFTKHIERHLVLKEQTMNLLKSQTFVNLAKAFAGETQARTRYEFMEYGMRNEGYKAMAEIVDTVAYQEFNHARMFYTFLQKADNAPIKNVEICTGYPFKQKWVILDNLKFAAEDEKEEATVIYPSFALTAKEEGFTEIAALFDMTAKVEEAHEKLFRELYTQLKEGTLYKKQKPVEWVCADCGYHHTGNEPWQICPVCKAKQGSVMLHL